MQTKFLNKLHKLQDNMIILVDTRLSKKQDKIFTKKWGQCCYFNSLCSNSSGMAALIRDTLDILDVVWENKIEGKLSKLTSIQNKQKYLMKCIYAPNKDSLEDEEEY